LPLLAERTDCFIVRDASKEDAWYIDLPDRSPVAADQVEHGEAVLVAGDGLTID
jgi:hypothetical protein